MCSFSFRRMRITCSSRAHHVICLLLASCCASIISHRSFASIIPHQSFELITRIDHSHRSFASVVRPRSFRINHSNRSFASIIRIDHLHRSFRIDRICVPAYPRLERLRSLMLSLRVTSRVHCNLHSADYHAVPTCRWSQRRSLTASWPAVAPRDRSGDPQLERQSLTLVIIAG